MSVRGGVGYMSAGTCRVQTKVRNPLELELQAVVSCLTWTLGTKLRFFAIATHALSHQDISPAFFKESDGLRKW